MNDAKTILITGCSSGIGYSSAKILRERGYRVFASARKVEDVERLRSEGFESVQLDLTDVVSISTAIDEVLEKTGGTLYALFNNGAYGQPAAVEDLKTDVLREQFETNFFGWHEITRRIIPVMRKQGYGRIIQDSSVLGFVAFKYRGAYNSSKYALEGLTDTMRMELKNTGIKVSIIEPGPIRTKFRENAYEAFKKNVDVANSPNKDIYETMVAKRLATKDEGGGFTLEPEAVVKKLIHALEAKRPKIRYYVTFPTYLMAFLKRILPHSAMDFILMRM